MKSDDTSMFGEGGGGVESDETFIGHAEGQTSRGAGVGYEHKMKVLTLVDRDSGAARSWVLPGRIRLDTIKPILEANIAKDARVLTDSARHYMRLDKTFPKHQSVNHVAGEYVNRDDRTLHTNTIEGYFSIFKRGMRGIYQHCKERHLHRYLAEFDFRYSNRIALGVDDNMRCETALKGTVGRRLTYHPPKRERATV